MTHLKRAIFRVGEHYTNEEVYLSLNVGNAGGIRPRLDDNGNVRRIVLMTSEPSAKVLRENPYHDRVEGDVLVYTAAGLEGRQEISGINRRLMSQPEIPFPIYAFSNIGSRRNAKLGPRRWRFLGLLQYMRHFIEKQLDARGEYRESLVFELLIHISPTEVPVENELAISRATCSTPATSMARDTSDRDTESQVASETILTAGVDGASIELTRRSLLALSPERFEHVVKEALQATGFERVSVTRYSGDGGVDVNAFAAKSLWPFQGSALQVQAKRWLHTVGRREVAELRGSLDPYSHGAIVTTSFYSKAAIAEAIAPSKRPIVLINGFEFSSILARLGIESAA